jgi:hypothetical protein
MVKKSDLPEVEKVSCAVCRKEIPLSNALTSEAADYMVYFCGLECYAKWKKRSESSGQQSKDPKNKP